MVKEIVHTDQAAVTGAPLVQAVKLGNLVFCSGASPRDPRQGNKVVEGGFKAQALQTAGLISYRRGRIQIVNRAGLEKASCECYAIVKERFDAFLTPPSTAVQGDTRHRKG